MNILGLSVHSGQTASALVTNGTVVAAAAEERFDRIKQSRAFPRQAIKYCLKEAGLDSPHQLDSIAVSWNPAENMRRINLSGFTNWRRYEPEWLYIVPNNLMSMAGVESFPSEMLKMELGLNDRCPLYFVGHHMSHIALAVAQSPFQKGLALAVDEYGEFDSVTVAQFEENNYRILKKIPYPNSLGVFFAAVTEFLGFTPNSDEWKVMGAAAYGDPGEYYERLQALIPWDVEEGTWTLDTRYIEHSNLKRAGYLNQRFSRLMGILPRTTGPNLEQEHFDIAAATQLVFERSMFNLINHYIKLTGETNLAAAGGCFMNSLANGKIYSNTLTKKMFIPYAAADNGGAIGSALAVWHYGQGNLRRPSFKSPTPYLGPEFTDNDIRQTLERYKLPYSQTNDIANLTADLITKGNLVGWFQGRMEFGERALGNRSILADPRRADMKDKINAAVKYREGFRPFAPSVLYERVSEFFNIPVGVEVPYMEQVYTIKEQLRAVIPAVVHTDGTGRLQTVRRESNPLYYRLIEEFDRLTGVPVLLNTSFNVQGEPIVCSPTDAVRTFFTCGLDVLILGSFYIHKEN
jgi:carbamoyltransferase